MSVLQVVLQQLGGPRPWHDNPTRGDRQRRLPRSRGVDDLGDRRGAARPWGVEQTCPELEVVAPEEAVDIAPRSSGEEDSRSLKPFRWNPAGNQSRPVELDQQPEASLAWRVGDHTCEA